MSKTSRTEKCNISRARKAKAPLFAGQHLARMEDALTETIILYAFCLGSKIVTLGLAPCSVDLYEILNEICKAAESFL